MTREQALEKSHKKTKPSGAQLWAVHFLNDGGHIVGKEPRAEFDAFAQPGHKGFKGNVHHAIVDRLIRKGWATFIQDRNADRLAHLELTDTGRAIAMHYPRKGPSIVKP